MSSGDVDGESEVSGTRAAIPDEVRHKLGIEDGDRLRWRLTDEDVVEVEVVQRESGTFHDFEGYEGEDETDVVDEHDGWGIGH